MRFFISILLLGTLFLPMQGQAAAFVRYIVDHHEKSCIMEGGDECSKCSGLIEGADERYSVEYGGCPEGYRLLSGGEEATQFWARIRDIQYCKETTVCDDPCYRPANEEIARDCLAGPM